MINKYVKNTVYFSLFIQFLTTFISLDGFNYQIMEKDKIMKNILLLESIAQCIESIFYIWVVVSLRNLSIMTSRRYIDWYLTTPTMLFNTIMFMEYLKNKEENKPQFTIMEFIIENKNTIIYLFILNALMLTSGLLGELKIINVIPSVIIGFIFFVLLFCHIYKNYAIHTELSMKLYIFMTTIWSLYGMAALMNPIVKNSMYNILDLFSKNFFGFFLYYYITTIGIRY